MIKAREMRILVRIIHGTMKLLQKMFTVYQYGYDIEWPSKILL